MLPMCRNSLIVGLIAYTIACNVVADTKTNDTPPVKPAPHQSNLYLIISNDRFGFIDPDGKLKIDLPQDVYTVFPFSDGRAVVAKRVPNTYGRWGFIDETGRVVIEPKFNGARPFSEGLAAIVVEREDGGGGLGYIDTTGRIVIEPQFGSPLDEVSAFSEGLAAVPLRNNRKWGYIDKTGKFVIAPKFSYASVFSEGRAWVGIPKAAWSIESKVGMIDAQGRWIVEPRFDFAGTFSEGLAAVELDRRMGYINRQGEIVIKVQFDSSGGCPDSESQRNHNRFSEGLAAVQQNWQWGYINHSGMFMIKPSFDCGEPFSEGLAIIGVRHEDEGFRYGYIDKTGAIVIEPRFSFARPFSGGRALVGVGMTEVQRMMKAFDAGKSVEQLEKEDPSVKMKSAYIDKSGKFVWGPTNYP